MEGRGGVGGGRRGRRGGRGGRDEELREEVVMHVEQEAEVHEGHGPELVQVIVLEGQDALSVLLREHPCWGAASVRVFGCVCVHVFVCVCVNMFVWIHESVCFDVFDIVGVCVCAFVCFCVGEKVSLCVNLSACIFVSVCVRVFFFLCTCVYSVNMGV